MISHHQKVSDKATINM